MGAKNAKITASVQVLQKRCFDTVLCKYLIKDQIFNIKPPKRHRPPTENDTKFTEKDFFKIF